MCTIFMEEIKKHYQKTWNEIEKMHRDETFSCLRSYIYIVIIVILPKYHLFKFNVISIHTQTKHFWNPIHGDSFKINLHRTIVYKQGWLKPQVDIWHCLKIQWGEIRDSANHPTMQTRHLLPQSNLAPNVNSVKVEQHWYKKGKIFGIYKINFKKKNM